MPGAGSVSVVVVPGLNAMLGRSDVEGAFAWLSGHSHAPGGAVSGRGDEKRKWIMKSVTLAVVAVAVMMLAIPASAKQNTTTANCAATMLEVVDGGVSVIEDGKTSRVAVEAPGKLTSLRAATTTCRSGGGYTVCSNGRYGCIWSDRSGNLLGCGRGI
jgi:hypothetical protein